MLKSLPDWAKKKLVSLEGRLEDGDKINIESLLAFDRFLKLVKPKIGKISLTPDNDIYCNWVNNQCSFSITFKGIVGQYVSRQVRDNMEDHEGF